MFTIILQLFINLLMLDNKPLAGINLRNNQLSIVRLSLLQISIILNKFLSCTDQCQGVNKIQQKYRVLEKSKFPFNQN